MPGITLRADGRYMVRKMVDGIRKNIYTKTKTEAQKILKNLQKNIIKVEKPPIVIYTIKKWFEEWLEIYKRKFVSETSFKQIRQAVDKIKKEFGNVLLDKLDAIKVQSYLNNLNHSRTKEKLILYFNAGMQKAVDLNKISYNPLKAIVKEPKLKKKQFAYTFNEQEKILSGLKNSNCQEEILCYLLTGARPRELPKKENFDFTNNLVHVYGTKNKTSLHRVIEISEEYSKRMELYFQKNKFHNYEDIAKEFKTICEKVKIKNGNIYRLRHTFASNQFQLGTHAKQVQEWLGHSNIQMTLDTYTDIDKTASREKITILYNNLYYVSKHWHQIWHQKTKLVFIIKALHCQYLLEVQPIKKYCFLS